MIFVIKIPTELRSMLKVTRRVDGAGGPTSDDPRGDAGGDTGGGLGGASVGWRVVVVVLKKPQKIR